MTVDYLLNNRSEYLSKIITVQGSIFNNYHGLFMCDENGEPCIRIFQPEDMSSSPKIDLVHDFMYEEFINLSLGKGSVDRTIGEAKLFATLRGYFNTETYTISGEEINVQNPSDIHVRSYFVLDKVIKIEIIPESELDHK